MRGNLMQAAISEFFEILGGSEPDKTVRVLKSAVEDGRV